MWLLHMPNPMLWGALAAVRCGWAAGCGGLTEASSRCSVPVVTKVAGSQPGASGGILRVLGAAEPKGPDEERGEARVEVPAALRAHQAR